MRSRLFALRQLLNAVSQALDFCTEAQHRRAPDTVLSEGDSLGLMRGLVWRLPTAPE